MKQRSGITIVIPVFNREQVVGKTLASVEAQTLRPLSVVLVDNASTDGSRRVLEEWAMRPHGIDVKVVDESTPGAAAARNRGLAEVDTEWTMIFDSDDTMEPAHCECALRMAGDADIVGWDVRYHDASGHTCIKPFHSTDMQYHSLFHGSMATLRYMARTSLFREAGGWNENIFYWDDIELGARLLKLSSRACHTGGPRVDVFLSGTSITGTRFSSRVESAMTALEAIGRTLGPDGRKLTAVKAAVLAADCSREGSPAGRALLDQLLDGASSRRERMLLKAVYYYRRLGGRGIARLIRPII